MDAASNNTGPELYCLSMMTLTTQEESVFVAQAQAGDPAAFGQLVEMYQKRAYAIAYGFVGNREDALEIAQEAFARAYKAMARFDTSLPFFPWLYRIVRNTSFNHLKKRKRRGETSLDNLMASGVDFATRGGGPAASARLGELRARINESMKQLTDPHREIIALRHVHELSYNEIAACLDIPRGTVMSRLHGARQSLRKVMETAC